MLQAISAHKIALGNSHICLVASNSVQPNDSQVLPAREGVGGGCSDSTALISG